jgi:hypothetical protein
VCRQSTGTGLYPLETSLDICCGRDSPNGGGRLGGGGDGLGGGGLGGRGGGGEGGGLGGFAAIKI